MLDSLRSFDSNKANIEELVSLRSYARGLLDEFDTQMVDPPEWVKFQAAALDRQIAAKNADRLAARKKEIESRLESLKTTTEKRAELKKELVNLDRQLAKV
jgi:hypothetical protein